MRFPIVLACVLGLTRVALARPAASAQAEAMFNDAKKLMGEKKYAEACDKFETSQKLDPAITTLLNAADCREKNGQLATAWSLFVDVERQARSIPGAQKLGTIANTRAAKLEPRLSKLTIKLAPEASKVSDLKVRIGTEPVLPGTFGSALPMDGGRYTITATGSGLPKFSATIDLAVEGDNKTVEISKPASDALPAAGSGVSAGDAKPIDEPIDAPDEPQVTGAPSRKPAIGMSVAAVGLAAGAIGFELWGRRLLDQSQFQDDPDIQDDLYNGANLRHYLAQGMGAASVAATGIAIYLWVRGGKGGSSSAAMIVPTAGGDQVGIVIMGGL